jgi:heterotetrameric sarcosine oxidase gamma subunit
MSEFSPIARSPIAAAAPMATLDGWEVSRRQSTAPMRLLDLTPCAKLLLRGTATPALRELLPRFGQARHAAAGPLIIAAVPEQFLLIGPPGATSGMQGWITSNLDHSRLTLTDLTHARVVLRIAGAHCAMMLSKVCAVNFGAAAFPHGAAVRSSLAKVPCEIIRDDLASMPKDTVSGISSDSTASILSYLIIFERQIGQYICETLIDAGSEYSIDVDGFSFD